MAKAFVGAVVQVDHRLLEIRGHALCIDCVTVIVSGHDDFAALEVLHRLVSAAMTVRQFESLRTACEGKQLMAKTHTVHWTLAQKRPQRFDRLRQVRWVARSRRDEYYLRIVLHDVLARCIIRQYRYVCSQCRQFANDRFLDAAIEQHDAQAAGAALYMLDLRSDAGNQVFGGRRAHEVRQARFGAFNCLFSHGKRSPNRSVFAQRDRDRSRVGVHHRRHVLLVQPRRQIDF